MKCEICEFNNPKGTATAVIIQDNKLLLLKRKEEPFRGMWDFPGGFMQENETPKESVLREIKEELGLDGNAIYIDCFSGYYTWKDKTFPVINHAFLVEVEGQVKLDDENSEYKWFPLKEEVEVAFDSNVKILKYVKENFSFDLERIKILIGQLDSTAEFNEQNLYRAVLEGVLSVFYEKDVLVGMGWSFARQTLLRKQAVIEDMIVDEEYRKKGFGYKILNQLVEQSKKDGVEVVELTTNPKREEANKLYQKYGFEQRITNNYHYKNDSMQ